MPTIRSFEDLMAWKEARVLARNLYAISRRDLLRRDFALVTQLRKTALSPMSNIAEGFGRRSDREFVNFLSVAHASVAEAQSLLYVCLDQNYVDETEFANAYEQSTSCSKLIQALMNYLWKTARRTRSTHPTSKTRNKGGPLPPTKHSSRPETRRTPTRRSDGPRRPLHPTDP